MDFFYGVSFPFPKLCDPPPPTLGAGYAGDQSFPTGRTSLSAPLKIMMIQNFILDIMQLDEGRPSARISLYHREMIRIGMTNHILYCTVN